jgi:hypothetical protein
MMRSRSWIKVTTTYGADYSGNFRGRDRLEAQQLVEDWADEINEDREIRELWNSYYRRMSPERADRLLDLDGFPKPPSRERRMPG